MKIYLVVAGRINEAYEAEDIKDAIDFFIEEHSYLSLEDITSVHAEPYQTQNG